MDIYIESHIYILSECEKTHILFIHAKELKNTRQLKIS
jgi:hypothetical protein